MGNTKNGFRLWSKFRSQRTKKGDFDSAESVAAYRNQLLHVTESRREIVAAFEIERRRIERDLHDGAQQSLVSLTMRVGQLLYSLDATPQEFGSDAELLATVRATLQGVQDDAERALRELRKTVHGIHPKMLDDLGLVACLEDLIQDTPLDVDLHVPHALVRLPDGVASVGYFFVSEALTNVAKYAPGAKVSVLVSSGEFLNISVIDDGPGGAALISGHGLAGLNERLLAAGGSLQVSSPTGGPTLLEAQVPLLLRPGQSTISFEGLS